MAVRWGRLCNVVPADVLMGSSTLRCRPSSTPAAGRCPYPAGLLALSTWPSSLILPSFAAWLPPLPLQLPCDDHQAGAHPRQLGPLHLAPHAAGGLTDWGGAGGSGSGRQCALDCGGGFE